MVIRGRAPLRVSFGGGGTDVEPFCVEQGGAIIGSTIDVYKRQSRQCADGAAGSSCTGRPECGGWTDCGADSRGPTGEPEQ